MQESMHANLLAAATLPSSAASTPSAVGAEHAFSPLAPCEGPIPHRASARSQRNTTQPMSAGLVAAPTRLASRSAVSREEQLAAAPSHAVQSTVQPHFAGAWPRQAGEVSGGLLTGASSNTEQTIGNGSWGAPRSHPSNASDPWSQPQHMGSSQTPAQQAAVPLVAEPYPQQQAYRWHQHPQLEPQTWQQQQQGWNYGRSSGNGNRDRSHSPRGRRRQHQQRMQQRNSIMGASHHPQQQWQQQISPSQPYEGQLQQGQQALVASQLPGHQLPAYQQLHLQQQQQAAVTAVDPWQSQQQMLPPPPPPTWWHQQMQQQQMAPWHQQLQQQQQWPGEGDSSSGGNWPVPPGADGTAAAYGAWAAYNSSQQDADAGLSAAAPAAPPRQDPTPTRYQITGSDRFSTTYHQLGHEPNLSTHEGLGPTNLVESPAASAAAPTSNTSWPAAVTQEQQAQQQQQQQPQRQHTNYNLQSHMLSQLETDSSEDPEEWFSVTHSPAPLELQQQQQGTMLLPTGSSRWHQTLSQGGTLSAASRAPAFDAAASLHSRPSQQQPADHSLAVVQDQRRVADSSLAVVPSSVDMNPTPTGDGGSSSSSSRFDDVSSDGDSDLPELIPSPGYAVDRFYEATDPSGAWLRPQPEPAAAAAGANDGSASWGISALQQQQQQAPARQAADAWVISQTPEQDPAQNSWPPPQQQQQRRLGSIDELQPTPYGPRSVDGLVALSQAAAAAATALDHAAAAQQDQQQQQLWSQEQQLLEQQLQQLEAEAAVHSSSPGTLASWREEELYRLGVDARRYMALGAAEDDGDSTAATAADSISVDGHPLPTAAAAAAAPLELPQLARVRTAAAPAARSGAALEDSPNAQMAQLMRRLTQQYDMLQQQQYTAAQLELEQQQILNRYGLAVGGRGNPRGAGFGGSSGSSNATAAGAPYRPLVAAAAGPAAADRPAGDRDDVLLRHLLDSASSATQEVDATAMAALAGTFEQQRQWRQQQWRQQQQQQQQQAGADLAAQWDFSARRRQGLRHGGGHDEVPHMLQHPAPVAQQLTHQISDSQRASIESMSWQDTIPPLLDADPQLDAFEGLTPTLSPHRLQHPGYRPQNPSYNTGLYPDYAAHVSDPAQPAPMLAGSAAAAAAAGVPGWVFSQAVPQGQASNPSMFGPSGGYLLPTPMAAAAAAGGGVGGSVVLGVSQQQQQLRLQVPPPGQLVLGRWSSSSGSSSGLSPLISPVVTAAGTSGQHDVAQTPTAAMLVPQQPPNAPRRRQQRQPLMALQQQQQQWAQAAAWPEYRQAVYGPYSGSSSAAATAGSAAGVANAGPLPPQIVTPGPGGSSSSSSGWQQLHGMTASMPSSGSSRSGGTPTIGQQSNMQGMTPSWLMSRSRHAQASAAPAAPAAMTADQVMPAAPAPVQGVWPLNAAAARAFEQQQQWQQDLLLAMQLDQPPISVTPLAQASATAAAAGLAAAAAAGPAAAAAAAVAAARQRQSDLQRLIQQARASISPREGPPNLTPITLQSTRGQRHMGILRELNSVESSRLVAGAGPGSLRPDLMVRMMRLMSLDEAVMLPRIIGGGDGLSYEQLVGLEDVRVVVPAHVLRQLPRRNVPKEDKPAATDAESVICTICQCELAGQELVVQLPCKHDYHEGCVCEWLSKYKKTCPVCKAEVKLDT